MAHKGEKEGYQIKTLKFKVRSHDIGKSLYDIVNEYTNYYNKVSKWICDNLDTPIGELSKNISEKRHNSKYYRATNDPNWKNEPMWKIFTKKFSNGETFSEQGKNDKLANLSNCDNILSYSIIDYNIDGYTGNILGLTDTSYRLNGYISNCISNYKTKIRTAKPKVRSTAITEHSTVEEKTNNTIYEMVRKGFMSPNDFKNQIKYLTEKENPNEKLIDRLSILHSFYTENEEDVNNAFSRMSVEMLKNNNGCTRNGDKKTLNISSIDYKVTRKEGCDGYILSFGSRNQKYNIDLWGRRDTISNGKELIDLSEHGEPLTITSENGDYYVCMTVDVPFEKKSTGSTEKVASVDVNTKHTMLSTDVIDDSTLKGYLNIYKKLLLDRELTSLLHKQDIDDMKELSNNVCFGPIEYNFLLSRILGLDTYEKKVEDRITQSMKEMLKSESDERNKMYLGSVIKMRALLKVYISTKNRYHKEQQSYDESMGFTDTSTASKDTMDKRRFENPFSETETGKKLNNDLSALSKKIIGCRDNIVRYAYTTLQDNGYTMIGVEDLNSSTFANTRNPFPTIKSLLNYHHLSGKTPEEARNIDTYSKFSDHYTLTTDEEGKITDAKYTKKAETKIKKKRARDTIIKAIHFAEVKDVMCVMSNNGTASVAFEPSYFSSQMDSATHKVYTTRNKKGKDVIASKETVRPRQEKHINGMNCDINSPKNLSYLITNEEFREMFLTPTKNGYNEPFYKSRVKSAASMMSGLKKLGATMPLTDENAIFSTPKPKKNIGKQ